LFPEYLSKALVPCLAKIVCFIVFVVEDSAVKEIELISDQLGEAAIFPCEGDREVKLVLLDTRSEPACSANGRPVEMFQVIEERRVFDREDFGFGVIICSSRDLI
jgi:hypothetical protein